MEHFTHICAAARKRGYLRKFVHYRNFFACEQAKLFWRFWTAKI